MQIDETDNQELLSTVARRLAARIAVLIDRTLDIYERDLEIAESTPPTLALNDDTLPPNRKALLSAQVVAVEDDSSHSTETRKTRRPTRLNILYSLRTLVSTMESLLRIARHASDLEQRDQQGSERELSREEIAELFGDIELEDEHGQRDIYKETTHSEFQSFKSEPNEIQSDIQLEPISIKSQCRSNHKPP